MLEIAGTALLPDWPLFLSFELAGLALNILPGGDMAFIMTAAARGGTGSLRRSGSAPGLWCT